MKYEMIILDSNGVEVPKQKKPIPMTFRQAEKAVKLMNETPSNYTYLVREIKEENYPKKKANNFLWI